MEEQDLETDTLEFAASKEIYLGKPLTVELAMRSRRVDETGEVWCEFQLGSNYTVSTCDGEVVSIDSSSLFVSGGRNLIGMSRADLVAHLKEEPYLQFEEVHEDWSYASLDWFGGDLVVTEVDGAAHGVIQLAADDSDD